MTLTFDCGAGDQSLATVMSTLQAENVTATFFVTGRFATSHAQLLRQLERRGFAIGNHTLTHPHLTRLSTAAATDEVTDGADAIVTATHHSPLPLFRFPYGEYDARTLQLVHSLGYGAIGWTVDTRGWQGREAGTAADVIARVRAALSPGEIVLMHIGANPDDGTTFDADALSAIISLVRQAGYQFVALTDAN